MLRSSRHPCRRGLPRRALLGPPLLALLAAAPLAGGWVPAPVTAVRAADCPLPPELCPPPTSDPTPRPTRRPATPAPSPTDAATPTAAATPTPAPTATPRPAATPRTSSAATTAPASTATSAPAGAVSPAASPAPSGSPPATGADPPRDATPVRTVGTVAPDRSAVRAWQVLLVGICAIALAVLLVVRTQRQRRRAALHTRFNRMRAERGLPPLTPRQIDFLGPRRRLF